MTGMVDERKGPRGALLLLVGLALAGCDSLGTAGGGGAGPAAAARAEGAIPATADIEAPEVFRVAEAGLWDGRPSLGGIWVAHPDVTDPERVRVVNTTNGQEVIGALFRRERDLPGPALQVSSDAAEALGMLAGAPAALEVTALRRQEPAAAPAEEPAPAVAEATPPAQEQAGAPPAEVAVAEPAAEAPAAPVDPAAVEAVARATAAILAAAPPASAPADAPAAAPGPAGAIATTTLDSAPSAGAAAPAASALERPFVQIGTYEAEANARAVATQIAGQGLPVTVVEGQGSWRLLLGPATTEAQQAALLDGAVAAGFADAYLVAS